MIKVIKKLLLILTIKDNNKYGFINLLNDAIIEPIYDEIRTINDHLISVSLHGQWFYIDSNGNQLK